MDQLAGYSSYASGMQNSFSNLGNLAQELKDKVDDDKYDMLEALASKYEEIGTTIGAAHIGLKGTWSSAKKVWDKFKNRNNKEGDENEDEDDVGNEGEEVEAGGEDAIDDVANSVSDLADKGGTMVSDLADGVGDTVESLVSKGSDMLESVSSSVEDAVSQATSRASSIAENLGQSIEDGVSQVRSFVSGLPDRVAQGIRNNLSDPVDRYSETSAPGDEITLPESETFTGQSETLTSTFRPGGTGESGIEMQEMGASKPQYDVGGERGIEMQDMDTGADTSQMGESLEDLGTRTSDITGGGEASEAWTDVGADVGEDVAEEAGEAAVEAGVAGVANAALDAIPILGEIVMAGTAVYFAGKGIADAVNGADEKSIMDNTATPQINATGKFVMPSFDITNELPSHFSGF